MAQTKPMVERKPAKRAYQARGGLLESIQGFGEEAHVVGTGGVDEPRRLLAVNLLLKKTVQECVVHIHLMHGPVSMCSDGADCGRLDDGAERLVEVNAGLLREPADHPPRLVPLQRAICTEFMAKQPLAADDVRSTGTGDERPRLVYLQSPELVLHCC